MREDCSSAGVLVIAVVVKRYLQISEDRPVKIKTRYNSKTILRPIMTVNCPYMVLFLL